MAPCLLVDRSSRFIVRVCVGAVSMGRGNVETVAGFVLVVVVVVLAVVPAASASPAEGFQPLSKIAIHRATVELQRSAYVRATPSLLGEQF
ncbi:hypothetical protein ACP70R_017836 [Stipagrostis hirtigluma subsp. patula]